MWSYKSDNGFHHKMWLLCAHVSRSIHPIPQSVPTFLGWGAPVNGSICVCVDKSFDLANNLGTLNVPKQLPRPGLLHLRALIHFAGFALVVLNDALRVRSARTAHRRSILRARHMGPDTPSSTRV